MGTWDVIRVRGHQRIGRVTKLDLCADKLGFFFLSRRMLSRQRRFRGQTALLRIYSVEISPVGDRTLGMSAWQREVILRNVANDPYYAPYCMRCMGLIRMRTVEQHYWRCACGAECDYRGETP